MISVAEAVKALEKSKEYRVLKRLPKLVAHPAQGEVYRGIYIDCETTGLDTVKDEIIELGAIPFGFTSDGNIVSIDAPYHSYNQPNKEISAAITEITKITPEMVHAKKLFIEEFDLLLSSANLVIAHNAEFDRPIIERYFESAKYKPWACSMNQVNWAKRNKRLEHIIANLGYFYDAHNAVSDCEAGLFALQSHGMAELLQATRQISWHVWANGAPFDMKDILKERKYFWNPGDNGKPKAWHKIVDDKDVEEQWLAKYVYKKMMSGAFFKEVSAVDRFTDRG